MHAPVDRDAAHPRPLPDSYWAATAGPQIALQALAGDTTADVAVVGGGFAGLRAALELAERGVDVVLVDAGEPGYGASGRNGGQVNPLPHVLPEKIIAQFGPRHAEAFFAAAIGAADELYSVVEKHGIECDLEQNGWLQAAHAPYRMQLLEERKRAWSQRGAAIDVLSRHDVEEISGSRAHYGGILMRRGGSVQPMSYTRGLAHAAVNAGVRIFSRTLAEGVKADAGKWVLTCCGTLNGSEHAGQVRVDKVLFATNGYTDDALSGLRKTILPLISIQAVSEPLSEALLANVLPKRTTFADTRRVIFYTRRVGTNRLAFGTLARNDGPVRDSDRRRIHLGVRHVFPQLADVHWDYYWTGRVAHTPDFMPHFHEPSPGLHAGLGFNGRGVAMATVMGRVLAERALGADPATLPFPTTALKPIPLHSFGATGVRLTARWYEFLDALDIYRNRQAETKPIERPSEELS